MMAETTFFRNPVKYVRDAARRFSDEKDAREAITRDEYFRNMLRWTMQTQEHLRLYGLDSAYMGLPETQEEFYNAAKGKGPYRDKPVFITAIISDSTEGSFLERLAEESVYVSLIRSPKDIRKGVIIHDQWGVNYWDSTRLTPHPVEREEGIIMREWMRGPISVKHYTKHFESMKSDLERR